jgi:FMN-dependent NADH-azoreductase
MPGPDASFETLKDTRATDEREGRPAPMRILRVDASARREGSVTRALTDRLIGTLCAQRPDAAVTVRDLADGVPLLDEGWVGANFTDPAERNQAQQDALAQSDALVAELKAADVLVIGAPVYNFGVPAALKAWIDQVARARVTFRYTEAGPVGLLEGKRAYVIAASGGTQAGSDIDFATPWLCHVLGFLGIKDVTVIAADRQMADSEARLRAESRIDAMAA